MSDLIYRQAAIDALLHNQEVYSNNFGTDAIDKYTTAIIANDVETIVQLPSAQPERKTGRWEWDEESGSFLCSECNSGYRDQPTLMGKPLFEYCPMCGAKMEDTDGN